MTDEVLPATFVLSYVPTLDEIKEVVGHRVRKVRRDLWRRLAVALLLTVLVIALTMRGAGPGAGPGDVVSGVVLGWMIALVYVNAADLIRLSSRRLARHRHGLNPALRRQYQVTVSAEGIVSRTAEVAMSFAWSAFTAIEETKRQFLLLGQDGEVEFSLPKHGLPDQSQAGPLRDLLGARIGLARRGAAAMPMNRR